MKKIVYIVLIGSVFTQIRLDPYISFGTNIGFSQKKGITLGYEVTGGVLKSMQYHVKFSLGRKYIIGKGTALFNKSVLKKANKINYLSAGGGLGVLGCEIGLAKMISTEGIEHKGRRANFYIGGFSFPVAVLLNPLTSAGILPTNFYSLERYSFKTESYFNHNLWQKFTITTEDCFACSDDQYFDKKNGIDPFAEE